MAGGTPVGEAPPALLLPPCRRSASSAIPATCGAGWRAAVPLRPCTQTSQEGGATLHAVGHTTEAVATRLAQQLLVAADEALHYALPPVRRREQRKRHGRRPAAGRPPGAAARLAAPLLHARQGGGHYFHKLGVFDLPWRFGRRARQSVGGAGAFSTTVLSAWCTAQSALEPPALNAGGWGCPGVPQKAQQDPVTSGDTQLTENSLTRAVVVDLCKYPRHLIARQIEAQQLCRRGGEVKAGVRLSSVRSLERTQAWPRHALERSGQPRSNHLERRAHLVGVNGAGPVCVHEVKALQQLLLLLLGQLGAQGLRAGFLLLCAF